MNRIKSLFISTIIFLIPAHLVIAQEQKEDLAQQAANLIKASLKSPKSLIILEL